MYLYAVIAWPAVTRLADRLFENEGHTEYEALHEAIHRITMDQVSRTSLPKRFSIPMREMLMMQRRFMQLRGVRAARLLEHNRFRAAYDFLLLRNAAGEVDSTVAEWWTELQAQSPEQQKAATSTTRKRRSRRGRGGGSSSPQPDAAGQ
jgi:poly(A) polymerase